MCKFLILFFALVVLSHGAKLPKNFKKCNRAKADFNDCLKDAIENAVPQMTTAYKEIDLPILTPLEVTKIDMEIKQNKVLVNQKLRNCKFFGFNNVQVKYLDVNFDEKFIKFRGFYPELKSECDYEVSGRVIILPIQGQGNASGASKNFDVWINATFTEYTKNGKTYGQFDNATINAIIDNMYIKMNNLFNGDKVLGDKMNEFVNENWKEILSEVGTDYLKFASELFLQITNRLFAKLSLEEAFDE